MSKRKANRNSIEAYKMSHELKQKHWDKIVSAMQLIGIACSSEAIAKKAAMKESQVYRRMSELLEESLVYVSAKGLTSSNRPCALYSLTEQGKERKTAVVEQPKKEKATTEYPTLFQL